VEHHFEIFHTVTERNRVVDYRNVVPYFLWARCDHVWHLDLANNLLPSYGQNLNLYCHKHCQMFLLFLHSY
jgi:hypothetical protein